MRQTLQQLAHGCQGKAATGLPHPDGAVGLACSDGGWHGFFAMHFVANYGRNYWTQVLFYRLKPKKWPGGRLHHDPRASVAREIGMAKNGSQVRLALRPGGMAVHAGGATKP